ncbi:PAAR domain-containing protein [Sulfurovum mangrovi]|uniref:PAAR domain-containing protein n=1 Tax=Sulfurovum mangrovi TaxID=2893889 RepID=UPI001E484551|nr:PAAR domain-containing protein [Sulfurovum mangrovi]UFH59983.1 PAAR domain-containing protein [Sulfurovum mangrovi]
MGLPAARLGDNTAHGTPLAPGPGSVNVLIGGRPAWRVNTDMHTCPLFTGDTAHVGGSVVAGSMSVLINGAPAARMNDQIIEASPAPNVIISGEPTVLIG